MAVEGGEGRRLSRHATAVSGIAWAPDGKAIYFLAAEAKTDEEKQKDKVKDDVFAFDENYKQQHLWRIDVASGDGAARSPRATSRVLGYRLSRDGRRIVHHRAPTPSYGDAEKGEVWVMDADGKNAVQLTKNGVAESDARAVARRRAGRCSSRQAQRQFETLLQRQPVRRAGGGRPGPRAGARLPVRRQRGGVVEGRPRHLLVANTGVRSEVFRFESAGGEAPRQLTKGDHAIIGWRLRGGGRPHVFCSSTSRRDPARCWTLTGRRKERPQPPRG